MDPAPAGGADGAVDLTQQRKDRAAHALAALKDLEAAIELEIEHADADKVPEHVCLAGDWLTGDVIETIEALT